MRWFIFDTDRNFLAIKNSYAEVRQTAEFSLGQIRVRKYGAGSYTAEQQHPEHDRMRSLNIYSEKTLKRQGGWDDILSQKKGWGW